MARFVLLTLAISSLVAVSASPIDGVLTLAPLYTPGPALASAEADAHLIPNSYMVILEDHLAPHEIDAHHAQLAGVHGAEQRIRSFKRSSGAHQDLDDAFAGLAHQFHIGRPGHGKRALKGYSGHFSDATIEAVRAMAGVKYVERDSLVQASEVELGAPWGLARISHRKPLSFGTFNRYDYEGNGGKGVDVYVIDTGVNIDHVELQGRAKWGKTIPKDADKDLNGHGSHCAGTIASAKYGVAKKANIIAVKVLGAGGSGSMSDVVAGVAWAADAAIEQMELKKKGKNPGHKGSVANMSLGGGKSPSLDKAVDTAVEYGLHFAVAAGNDNKDACAYSPAASKNAITVGASTIADERAYFSNHGPCVDIMAPGLNILSIWNTNNVSTNTISGTSMASPHVAGAAAYFLSLYPESFDVDTMQLKADASNTYSLKQSAQLVFGKVQEWAGIAPLPIDNELTGPQLKAILLKVGTKGALTDVLPAGTPNVLLFNNYTTSA